MTPRAFLVLLLPAVACQAPADDSDTWTFDEVDPPSWLPPYTVSGEASGHTLVNLAVGAGGSQHGLVLFDPRGNPVWALSLDGHSGSIDVDATWQDDGTVLIGGAATARRVDQSGATLWRADPRWGSHHDTALTSDDTVLSLVDTDNEDPDGEAILGVRLEELDPETGELLWSWDSQDAVDAGELVPYPGRSDAFHANAVAPTRDGDDLLVSLKATSQILRLDVETGGLDWILGADGDFELREGHGPGDPADWFSGQHDPDWSEHGLVVFDNGDDRDGDTPTRVGVYDIDEDTLEARLSWTWSEPGWHEPIGGGADWLTDGGVLVASGHCDHCAGAGTSASSFVAELPAGGGEPVWRLQFDDSTTQLYRAQRID